MMKALTNRAISALIMLSTVFLPSAASSQELDFYDLFNLTERRDGYYTMIDQADGSELLRTARILRVGTEFVDRQNRLFRVVSVTEDRAIAQKIEDNLPAAAGIEDTRGGLQLPVYPVQADEGERPKVGIYHSHGAESYVPSDGDDSIEQGGGILDVGERFSEALEQKGVDTVHETETHVPHDAGAYMRSRRTAEQLLSEEQVDLKIDVHRDATPPEAYEAVVNGEQVTNLLLVVGAQNQNAANNKQVAKELKTIADERYPGLVKGILSAPGSYNQDLSPNSILVEVGAHQNKKEEAKRAVTMFADVVDIYLTGEAAPEEQARQGSVALNRALLILGLLAASVLIYLYISAGSWEEMKSKIMTFFQREFVDLRTGWKRIKKRDDDK